jgi:hypothetical protein
MSERASAVAPPGVDSPLDRIPDYRPGYRLGYRLGYQSWEFRSFNRQFSFHRELLP